MVSGSRRCPAATPSHHRGQIANHRWKFSSASRRLRDLCLIGRTAYTRRILEQILRMTLGVIAVLPIPMNDLTRVLAATVRRSR
jgi:hypothetical protein